MFAIAVSSPTCGVMHDQIGYQQKINGVSTVARVENVGRAAAMGHCFGMGDADSTAIGQTHRKRLEGAGLVKFP